MVTETVQNTLERALEDARSVCSTQGSTSPACAAHWDVVEELHAVLADNRSKPSEPSSLEAHCDLNPDSLECRVYDV